MSACLGPCLGFGDSAPRFFCRPWLSGALAIAVVGAPASDRSLPLLLRRRFVFVFIFLRNIGRIKYIYTNYRKFKQDQLKCRPNCAIMAGKGIPQALQSAHPYRSLRTTFFFCVQAPGVRAADGASRAPVLLFCSHSPATTQRSVNSHESDGSETHLGGWQHLLRIRLRQLCRPGLRNCVQHLHGRLSGDCIRPLLHRSDGRDDLSPDRQLRNHRR